MTVSIRPAAIYGPGEARHFPRVIRYMSYGLYRFTIGSPDALVDWLHVDNFARANALADQKLKEEAKDVILVQSAKKKSGERSENSSVGGKGIFISDGRPINNFEFFRPLCEGLGYPQPNLNFPVESMLRIARVIEGLMRALMWLPGGWALLGVLPTLSRCEVNKCGVTHYFSMEPAKRRIGYHPQQYDLKRDVIQWYIDKGYTTTRSSSKAVAAVVLETTKVLVILALFCTIALPVWYIARS